jgi:hypothetical protein
VAILDDYGDDSSKQSKRKMIGARSKKNFGFWWRIEEDWIKRVLMKFLRFWRIGGKVCCEFL